MADEHDAAADGPSGTSRERVLASLLGATRELMMARDAEAICQVTVDAASERLGYDLVGVHLVPGAPRTEAADSGDLPDTLPAVAWTPALVDLIGAEPPPAIEPGFGVAWESFAAGEIRVFDDLRAADVDLMDPDTAFRSELHVPLGRHGVLIIGSAEVDEFDAEDVYFARILAANTAAALDNLAAQRAVERREQELARQNRRLEEFADVISHDLRNPLSVAQGTLNLGLETGDREQFETARDALDRMEALVDGLLTLAKEGRTVGDTSVVDVAAVAERAWETVDTEGAALLTDAAELQADPDRLRQLLENLFRNAVEHGTTDPAALTVRVGPLPASGFFVADDGIGIPADERDTVFDHGISGGDGTGFGLTIVRTIAEAHGWSVAVTESETGGARFEFRPDG